MNLETEIRAFIVENFLFGDESRAPGADESLIQNDLVDSTGVLELVAFIEDRFAVAVADEDITPDNLDSIARIAAFVTAKQTAAGVRAA